jgi:hypothetical protein
MTQKVVTIDEAVTGQNFLLLLFLVLFGRYVKNIRGTFVEYVKKSPNSTHPTVLVKNPHYCIYCRDDIDIHLYGY